MQAWLQIDPNSNRVNGFYKVEFGYPVRNLVYEPDSDQPLTPIKGDVLFNDDWILGRWTSTGQVLVLQFNIKWSLVEIDEAEWKTLMSEVKKHQLELFELQ